MKDSDLAEFFKSYVKKYTVGVDDVVYKFVGDANEQSGQVEASLDIQYIMGPAPHVKTEFWLWKGMDFCGDLKNWTETILSTSSPPLVHSVSYGWQGDLSALNCEQDKIDAVDGDFTKLAARGISIIFGNVSFRFRRLSTSDNNNNNNNSIWRFRIWVHFTDAQLWQQP